jgi:hypothetical protein
MPRPESVSDLSEPRPWERPGAVRRDCTPHRGPLLGFLSGVALLGALLSYGVLILVPQPLGLIAFGPLWLAALAFAVTVYAIARKDLASMAAGLMDPDGGPTTTGARNRAFGAVTVCLMGVLQVGVLLGVLWLLS